MINEFNPEKALDHLITHRCMPPLQSTNPLTEKGVSQSRGRKRKSNGNCVTKVYPVIFPRIIIVDCNMIKQAGPGMREQLEKIKQISIQVNTILGNQTEIGILPDSLPDRGILSRKMEIVNQDWPEQSIKYGKLADPLMFGVLGISGHQELNASNNEVMIIKKKSKNKNIQGNQPNTLNEKNNNSPAERIPDIHKAKTKEAQHQHEDELDALISHETNQLQNPPFGSKISDILHFLDEDADAGTDGYALEESPITSLQHTSSKPSPEIADEPNSKPHFPEHILPVTDPTSFSAKYLAQTLDPSSCANHPTITVLTKVMEYYESIGDQWRSIGYRKAIASLRRCTTAIETSSEARKLPGIGARMAEKIQEIAQYGHLRQLEAITATANTYSSSSSEVGSLHVKGSTATDTPGDRAKVLSLLKGIHGVGPATALKWYNQGIRTLSNVKAHKLDKHQLSVPQAIGLSRYKDFNTRIPREEVQRHFELVAKAVHEIDPRCTVECVGSFRRGKRDCGDIDVLITQKGKTRHELAIVVALTVKKLMKDGVIMDSLSGPPPDLSEPHGVASSSDDSIYEQLYSEPASCTGSEDEDSPAIHDANPRRLKRPRVEHNSGSSSSSTLCAGIKRAQSAHHHRSRACAMRGAPSRLLPNPEKTKVPLSCRRTQNQLSSSTGPSFWSHPVPFTTFARSIGRLWMGSSVLPHVGIHRRIDIITASWSERGAALLHYTGSDLFNRCLRVIAIKKGYHLSHLGLFRNLTGNVRNSGNATNGTHLSVNKSVKGLLVEASDEQKIFQILGVEYKPPHQRSIK